MGHSITFSLWLYCEVIHIKMNKNDFCIPHQMSALIGYVSVQVSIMQWIFYWYSLFCENYWYFCCFDYSFIVCVMRLCVCDYCGIFLFYCIFTIRHGVSLLFGAIFFYWRPSLARQQRIHSQVYRQEVKKENRVNFRGNI